MDDNSSNLPDWLTASPSDSKELVTNKKTNLALLHTQYENMFEGVLVKLSSGIPLTEIIRSDLREIEYEHILRWINSDEERKCRYQEAQELGTEVLAGEILRIADGVDEEGNMVLEDVQRSKLRIDTRKFVMGAWNRKRYGENKQIEQNVVIDIGQAMLDAQKRVEDRGVIIDAS